LSSFVLFSPWCSSVATGIAAISGVVRPARKLANMSLAHSSILRPLLSMPPSREIRARARRHSLGAAQPPGEQLAARDNAHAVTPRLPRSHLLCVRRELLFPAPT